MMKFFVLLFCLPLVASAESKSKGELRFESRFFNNDNNQSTRDENVAMATQFEGEADVFSDQQLAYRFFMRADQKDQSRSRILVQDLHYKYSNNVFQIGAGAFLKNLSSLEAFHPVDIFNPRNFDSDLENAEKIGQLGVSAKLFFARGELELMLLPLSSSPKYPSASNRLGFGSVSQLITNDLFIDKDGRHKDNDLQVFLRSAFFLDSFDFSLFYARMYDVSLPRFSVELAGFTPIAAHPIYFLSDQFAATFQTSYFDSQIIKLEMIYKTYTDQTVENYNGQPVRDFEAQELNPNDHLTTALGWEYILNHQSGMDSNFFIEWQSIEASQSQKLGFFQNDLFFGYRLSLNDTDAKELVLSWIQDLDESGEYLTNIRYGARLNAEWSYRIGVRFFEAKSASNTLGMGLFRQADHAYLNLSRFF
jgi:hypothetical protein